MELDRLIRDGKYPNCTRFAKKWECTRKTVQRDVTYLKDSLGAPIEYDYFRKGYYYTVPGWRLPGLDLTEGELFLLLVAGRMAEQYKGTPLAANLEGLFTKIRATLPDKVTIDPTYFKTQLISFHGHPVREISQKIWIGIFKALRANKVIQISYQKPGSTAPEQREVEPLHMACIDGEWYLIAYCLLRKDLRHFGISRIVSVKQTRRTFKPREFDPKAYFENRFARYIGAPEEKHQIVIRFTGEAAQWVTERIWHPKQRIKKQSNGNAILSFPAPVLYEVKRWVLQWGADAEVIEPRELRESIRKDIQLLGRKYV